MKKRGWIFAMLIIALFLVTPAGASDLSKLIDGLSQGVRLVDNEAVGQFFAASLDKASGLSDNTKEITRLQTIGSRLVSANRLPNYNLAILNGMDFNACSIYGHRIRVYHGLIQDTQNSESELAAVVAHEIAHQELGHNRRAVERFKVNYALDLAKIKLPTYATIAANAVLAKRSREDEQAADAQALRYMTKTGYSTRGAIAVYRRIEAEHKIEQKKYGSNLVQQRFNQVFATHPEPATRAIMAEDYLFVQKYGSTFKDEISAPGKLVKLAKSCAYAGNSPIIYAHPGQWQTPLSDTGAISAIGIFNPSPASADEQSEVNVYLDILKRGQFVGVTGDNDFHFATKEDLNRNYTFIDCASAQKNDLMAAIKNGQTYASAFGIKIVDENFRFGDSYPKVRRVNFRFQLELPLGILVAPEIQVMRNNQWIATLKKTNSRLERQPEYQFTDTRLKPGFYWYVLYAPRQLITSPITLELTNNRRDLIAMATAPIYRKGIIHCHSRHSDGSWPVKNIWQMAKEGGAEFVFMTNHADCFGAKVNHKLRVPMHPHGLNNPYAGYISDCRNASAQMIAGVEFPLGDVNQTNHLLILGKDSISIYKKTDEAEFFGATTAKTIILKGPFHLGDDFKESEIEQDAVFPFGKVNATVRLRIKGSPFKDPILWINRQEIGRVVTTDNKWHWFEFPVPADILNNGQNLFHIESFIPNRWNTFDDCEIADISISPTS